MSRYPLGQPVTIPVTVRDRTGALVDAGALTILVKITNADGTKTVTGTYPSPAHDSLGTYHQDIPVTDLTLTGHYQYTATATGTGAGVVPGDFDVYDPFEDALLPLQDAKLQLNIRASDGTAYDAELQDYIATIETSLEALTGGPLAARVVTERAELDGTGTVLQVQQRPVISVTSITPVATGIPADLSAGLDIDKSAGIIRALGGRTLGSSWNAGVTVVYPAGWVPVPAAFGIAGRMILQHMWDTQHGPSARPSMGAAETVPVPGFGFAIPYQAAELLNGSQGGIPFRLEVFA